MQRYENTYVHIPHLVAAIIIAEAVGVVGAFYALQELSGWYAALVKPSFAAIWVFGPAWLLVYALLGAAAYRVWSYGDRWSPALTVCTVQIILNALWAPLFFGLHATQLALLDMALLEIVTLVTLGMFYRRSRLAAGFLLPYVLLITFYLALNFEIWRMN